MTLSERLRTIANLVPINTIIADIGTDHGYIPVYLIENKIAKKAIGTDISRNSLEKIIQFVKLKGLEESIDIRLGDGFEVLKPFEIDTVIIAGMGGMLIKEILDNHKSITDTITNFILQPNIASEELREYLYKNNFLICDEKLVKESDKYYEIIYAKRGKAYLEDDIYLEIGEKLISNQDPLLKEFIEHKIILIKNIIEKLEDKNSKRSRERYDELANKIQQLKVVLEEIEGN